MVKSACKKGLIPQRYAGLPEELLIDNMYQTAYFDGIYTGYILAYKRYKSEKSG